MIESQTKTQMICAASNMVVHLLQDLIVIVMQAKHSVTWAGHAPRLHAHAVDVLSARVHTNEVNRHLLAR